VILEKFEKILKIPVFPSGRSTGTAKPCRWISGNNQPQTNNTNINIKTTTQFPSFTSKYRCSCTKIETNISSRPSNHWLPSQKPRPLVYPPREREGRASDHEILQPAGSTLKIYIYIYIYTLNLCETRTLSNPSFLTPRNSSTTWRAQLRKAKRRLTPKPLQLIYHLNPPRQVLIVFTLRPSQSKPTVALSTSRIRPSSLRL
jgi:hypothetical protein